MITTIWRHPCNGRYARIGCLFLVLVSLVLPVEAAPQSDDVFMILVLDDVTGRGVPLVELKTTSNIRYYTDSYGLAAIREPELFGRRVFFHVRSHGYSYPKDGFGFRGKVLDVTSGEEVTLRINRDNVAERLYRVTGAGIYRDSLLAGKQVPLERPLGNAEVTGSDSVLTANYRGKIYWFWGDTNRVRYPLGNFQVTGATSELPENGGLDPAAGVNLHYFTRDDGFARAMTDIPGAGLTWLSGLVVTHETTGRQRMFAHYVKVKPSQKLWDITARGVAVYDNETNRFTKVAAFPAEEPFPHGAHPVVRIEGGTRFIYFCDPYPLVRVPADPEKISRQHSYESFTCSRQEAVDPDREQTDRGPDGRLRFAWKTQTPPTTIERMKKLIENGQATPQDNVFALRDIATGKSVHAHRGTIYRNAYRKRWVMITGEKWGTSLLGETWYAEADHLMGPWVYARKIVTHDNYSFYNPKQHPMFDQDHGRVIFFEGTYTRTFSGTDVATPCYDYNQIMYRLTLSDERLFLPVPVYQLDGVGEDESQYQLKTSIDTAARWGDVQGIAFFALPVDRSTPGSIPVYAHRASGQTILQTGRPIDPQRLLFHALPAVEKSQEASPDVVPLYRFTHRSSGARRYSTEEASGDVAWERAQEALCRVWKNPISLPVWIY